MGVVIDDVRVFDGVEPVTWTAVRIAAGTVQACGGPEVRVKGDEVVDGGGGMLLPGFFDAHVHLLPGVLQQALTFGVTTELDLFSKPDLLTQALRQAHGDPAAADLRSSGVGATAPGGHPSMMYAPFPYVTGPGDAEGFVDDRLGEGAAFLKVLYDAEGVGPFSWPSLDVATVTALVEAAHARGVLVVAHATSAVAARDVVRAGVDVLAHVPIDAVDDMLIEEVHARGVAVIGTLVTIDGFAATPSGPALLADPHLAPIIGPAWGEVLRASADRWRAPGMPDVTTAMENIARLNAAGVTVLAGTDAPNPGTLHGASLHRELELLVAAGLTPPQALVAATSAPARVFGLHDRGRIEPGMRADLLLVDGDPLTDIRETRRIRAIWRGGVPCERSRYVGSAAEAAGIAALQAQYQRVVEAARARWPDGAAGGAP